MKTGIKYPFKVVCKYMKPEDKIRIMQPKTLVLKSKSSFLSINQNNTKQAIPKTKGKIIPHM